MCKSGLLFIDKENINNIWREKYCFIIIWEEKFFFMSWIKLVGK